MLANSAAEYSDLDKGKLLYGVFYKHKVFHNLLYPQGGSIAVTSGLVMCRVIPNSSTGEYSSVV